MKERKDMNFDDKCELQNGLMVYNALPDDCSSLKMVECLINPHIPDDVKEAIKFLLAYSVDTGPDSYKNMNVEGSSPYAEFMSRTFAITRQFTSVNRT